MTDSGENLKRIFDIFDLNHDKELDRAEFYEAVRSLGLNPTQRDLDEIMADADLDENGVISFKEFKRLYKLAKAGNEYGVEDIKELYKKCNRSVGEYITINEIREILSGEGEPLSDKEINKIIKDFDKNGDGVVNLNEFLEKLMS